MSTNPTRGYIRLPARPEARILANREPVIAEPNNRESVSSAPAGHNDATQRFVVKLAGGYNRKQES